MISKLKNDIYKNGRHFQELILGPLLLSGKLFWLSSVSQIKSFSQSHK